MKGYFNTSISDILEATDLTKGGLYGHFRSKEDIWYAVYDEAVSIWRSIVFAGVRSISDPIERIEKVIDNDLLQYVGKDVFAGGCFFINSLVELSGQSNRMSSHILRGYVQFSRLFRQWLIEAHEKGMLRDGLNYKEISNFILISLNGAAALYASSRDHGILTLTAGQLSTHISQLGR
ncbi:MAG: TetR/AcrR family transcriptional regulator [Deltaproteobacteria bacterium]|nr:TetR/AcrR family transcriptional regulator [Deltaproteobacteria bacterium]